MKSKISTKARIFHMLRRAMKYNYINGINGIIACPSGWVPQWVFTDILLCGSTEGKRRLRELRADPEMQSKYIWEKKHDKHDWYYRIRPRPKQPSQLRMTLAEAR